MKKTQSLNPYANLQLAPAKVVPQQQREGLRAEAKNRSLGIRPRKPGRPRSASTVREAAKAYPLYFHPAAHKALKIYAAESGRKMHDLLVEAVEEWFAKHGISQPVRSNPVVEEERPR
jgi:hypothetical protein